MEIKEITETLQHLLKDSPKRNFKQTVDMIVTLKNLDLKKPDQQVDFFMQLHQPRPKKAKICGLVGYELSDQSKEIFDKTIIYDEFPNLTKRQIKTLARSYDFFVAQGDIMQKVAATFGRSLGPLGKMPNPKAGAVVPANANLTQVAQRLQATIRITVKSNLSCQVPIGLEDTDMDILADNAKTIYDQLVHHLPQEKNNVKEVMFKLTMGRPYVLGEKPAEETKKATGKPEEKTAEAEA